MDQISMSKWSSVQVCSVPESLNFTFFFIFHVKDLKNVEVSPVRKYWRKYAILNLVFNACFHYKKIWKRWIRWKHTRHYGPLVECMWSNGSQALYTYGSGITATIHLWSVNIVDVSAPLAFMKYHAVHRAVHFIVLSHRAWYRFIFMDRIYYFSLC